MSESEREKERKEHRKIYSNQWEWSVRLNVNDISSQRQTIIENKLIALCVFCFFIRLLFVLQAADR